MALVSPASGSFGVNEAGSPGVNEDGSFGVKEDGSFGVNDGVPAGAGRSYGHGRPVSVGPSLDAPYDARLGLSNDERSAGGVMKPKAGGPPFPPPAAA